MRRYIRIYLVFLFVLLPTVILAGSFHMKHLVTFVGEGDSDQLGYSVSACGDQNGDGYDDVLVGVPGYEVDSVRVGAVFLYFGGNLMDSLPDVVFTGYVPKGGFGARVSGRGDVNGDSCNDILVSASNQHRVYLFYGGNMLDSIPDVIFQGTSNFFGHPISFSGDVNKDGYDDILIGDENRVYLYYGGAQMDTIPDLVFAEDIPGQNYFGTQIASGGDVNGDGYGDVMVNNEVPSEDDYYTYIYLGGANPDTVTDLILHHKGSGYHHISCVGDINDDNCSDIGVGIYEVDYDEYYSYIYLGGSQMDTVADYNIPYGETIEGAGRVDKDGYDDIIIGCSGIPTQVGSFRIFLGGRWIDTSPIFSYIGDDFGAFGRTVSTAGDVNGDGVDDVIVGEPMWPYWKERYIGRAHIFVGDSSYNWVRPGGGEENLPRGFRLEQNYPNPFNATTTLRYALPAVSHQQSAVSLKIYNLLGKEVRTLVSKRQRGGYYRVSWDERDGKGEKVGSGIYFYRLEVKGDRFKVTRTRKMLLLR